MTDDVKFFNFGGQVNYARDEARIKAIQSGEPRNPETNLEIDEIIKSIEEDLGCIKREDAEAIKETLAMVKEEVDKPTPKESGIKRCIVLLAPMLTIVNEVPRLLNNLQALITYLQNLHMG